MVDTLEQSCEECAVHSPVMIEGTPLHYCKTREAYVDPILAANGCEFYPTGVAQNE